MRAISTGFTVWEAQAMTKYEWSEPKSRKWVPVVRFIIAYIFFLVFSVGLTEEAFIAMAPLATPAIDPDAISNEIGRAHV